MPSRAYEAVRTTTLFAVGPVGEAGVTSEPEKAFRALLRQPDASTQLQRLLTSASAEGQLYALLGLHALDPQAYQTAVPRYLQRVAEVQTQEGCLVFPRATKELVADIQAGKLQ